MSAAAVDSNQEPASLPAAVTYPDDPNTRPHLRERELTIVRQGFDPIRPELEVKAFDFTPIPYDPIEAAKLPPVVYDTLEVYAGYSNDSIMLKLGSLGTLIDALTELKQALATRDWALTEIRSHDAAGRDYATMTNDCRDAVKAVAEHLGRDFEQVWVELVKAARS